MNVIHIKHKQIAQITNDLLTVLEHRDCRQCIEAVAVVMAMMADSVMDEQGERIGEEFKADFFDLVYKAFEKV